LDLGIINRGRFNPDSLTGSQHFFRDGFWNKKSLILLLLFALYCQSNHPPSSVKSIVNPAHLDHLYEQIEVDGRKMALIHIYSDYPDYKWAWETHEGIACVDDVSRAAIFYTDYYCFSNDTLYLKKISELSEFLLYMQAENGYFYNFILEDYSINKTYKRSIPIDNWWTWRALWALSEIYPIMRIEDKMLAERIWNSLSMTIDRVLKEYRFNKEFRMVEGFQIPTWLPSDGGSDQGATLVLGLLNYYKYNKDQKILNLIERLCDGICLMQAGDSLHFPYGAILSWENNWHAWGSIQSSVLLKVYQILKKEKYLTSSLLEINHFYQFLIKENYACELKLQKEGDRILKLDYKKAPQIAYGIRPMIYACLEAYQVTSDVKYATQAGRIASWFFGDNFMQTIMYYPESGICFDGINADQSINLNSGAESTIEALLALLAIEQNPHARVRLMECYLKKN
jgi:hypothetical protein